VTSNLRDRDSVAKIDPSVANTALVQEFQLYAYIAGQNPLAAAKHSRDDEQLILINKPGPDGLRSQVRPSHRNIVRHLSLQAANRLRVEFPLKARLRCRDSRQRFGIDDLIGGLPDPSEVHDDWRPIRNDLRRFPNGHRLIILASIE